MARRTMDSIIAPEAKSLKLHSWTMARALGVPVTELLE